MSLTNEATVPIQHADRFFIDGGWVEPSSDSAFDVIDSGTEEVYFRVAEAQAADIDSAVTAARRAFDEGPWPMMRHEERAEFLRASRRASESGRRTSVRSGRVSQASCT